MSESKNNIIRAKRSIKSERALSTSIAAKKYIVARGVTFSAAAVSVDASLATHRDYTVNIERNLLSVSSIFRNKKNCLTCAALFNMYYVSAITTNTHCI